MQKNQQNLIFQQPKKKGIKKPELSSMRSKNQNEKKKEQLIEECRIYYGYKLMTLVNKVVNTKDFKNKTNEYLFQALNKQANIKTKYKYRQKINYNKFEILKSLQYNYQELLLKKQHKQFQEIYDDLDDDDEDDDQQPKQQLQQSQTHQNKLSIQDFQNYKILNNIQKNTKIFIIQKYQDLANYFIKNGWIQNSNPNSLIYDFKFITKSKQIDQKNILSHQIINHYEKTGCLTTKFGLSRHLKNLIQQNIDYNKFYPRCYDLYDKAQFQDWIQNFKINKIISILKNNKNCTERIKMCLDIIKRYNLSLQQKIQFIKLQKTFLITNLEWQKINKIQQDQNIQNIQDFEQIIQKELQKYKQNDIQFNLNKGNNIWIVKPASRSRGRGIKTFSKLDEILDYVIGKDQIQWVVQKYIQNPLIIKNRKFDIRQWVVLSNVKKPMSIWFYDQFYVRFSAQDYTVQNIKNRYVHLTNNSIAKHSQNFINQQIKGNMFFQSQFFQFLQNDIKLKNQISNNTTYKNIFKKKMQNIVINSLKSISDTIVPRINTIQIYGYDFMIDQQYNPWLIQVNSSPSMEYSTHVTQKLVKEGLTDFGILVCDYMQYKGKKKEEIGKKYGNWRLIYNN